MKKKNVDAIRNLTFEITKDDIRKGVPLDKNHCVASCGLNNTVPGLLAAEVGSAVTTLITGSNSQPIRTRYRTSPIMRAGLKEFDRTGKWNLSPGKFTLLAPSPSQRLDYKTDWNDRNPQRAHDNKGKTRTHRRPEIDSRLLVWNAAKKVRAEEAAAA